MKKKKLTSRMNNVVNLKLFSILGPDQRPGYKILEVPIKGGVNVGRACFRKNLVEVMSVAFRFGNTIGLSNRTFRLARSQFASKYAEFGEPVHDKRKNNANDKII